MTANAFAEDRKRAVDIGMNGHIAKPIDIEKTEKVIHLVLNKQKNEKKKQKWKENERKKSDCRHSACGNFSSHPGRV